MRLDQFLSENFNMSRSRAQLLIKSGGVRINGDIINKSNKTVMHTDIVIYDDTVKYVSRAGLKLEYALDYFHIDIQGVRALDIGSSTGGFTDCLLSRGVLHVDAVDVGTGQLHETLRSNERVSLYENTDIRNFSQVGTYDVIVTDVSFISLLHIIPTLPKLSHSGTLGVLLIKPQFEVGKEFLNKQGIVTDVVVIDQVITHIKNFLQQHGYFVQGIVPSPILGGDGNREFLILVQF